MTSLYQRPDSDLERDMSWWILTLSTCIAFASATLGCASSEPATGAPASMSASDTPRSAGPRFNAAGELLPPKDYRTWTFLTSGFAMAYGPAAVAMAESGIRVLDNVYVQREAHDSFQQTGVWPEGTLFVLEIRTAEGTGSIVNGGHFQTDLSGIEVALKDSRRFAGGWGYFDFESDEHGPSRPAAPLPATASCYTCHAKNGAVENTFTQFYPTLFPIARAKGTVRADFVGIPPTSTELVARVEAQGWAAGESLLAHTAEHWPKANLLRERALNTAGYRLLQAGKKAEALSVFEHVTSRFPQSINAWDSLSEAQEAAGNTREALASVDQALGLLAKDASLNPDLRQRLERGLRDRQTRLSRPAP
jgi:hypothetical protein